MRGVSGGRTLRDRRGIARGVVGGGGGKGGVSFDEDVEGASPFGFFGV